MDFPTKIFNGFLYGQYLWEILFFDVVYRKFFRHEVHQKFPTNIVYRKFSTDYCLWITKNPSVKIFCYYFSNGLLFVKNCDLLTDF